MDDDYYIQRELRPMVRQLRARYSGVHIVQATRRECPCRPGIVQQSIRYCAPLATLKRHGLLTDAMLRAKAAHRPSNCEDVMAGDGWHLCEEFDSLSIPGCWDMEVWTESVPRERLRIGVKDAARILRRIAKAAAAA